MSIKNIKTKCLPKGLKNIIFHNFERINGLNQLNVRNKLFKTPLNC